MNKTRSALIIVLIIGALSIVLGLVQLFAPEPSMDHFFSLFIGVTLVGTAFFQLRKKDSKDKE
jgi:uncharacterized membrane protein HdeD (DUF308 family)